MHTLRRTLLFTITVGTFSATSLLAQHGGGVGGRVALPSSTALGAGALSAFPSSTSRSSAPATGRLSYGRPGGAPTPVYSGSRNYNSRPNTSGRREYRPLPRSYVAAPYFYPLFDWSGGTDYSAAPPPDDSAGYGNGPDPTTDAMMANQAAMGQQVQRLTDQVNDLMYGSGYPQQAQAAPQQPETPPAAPLTLVLRSGEQIQVQNYAVTDNTFWDFAQRGTRKIPLSSIDLAASAKATQASGGEFPQIGPSK